MFALFVLIILLKAESCIAAKIVGFSPIGGSHYLLIKNAMEELASRGHEVMYVTYVMFKTQAVVFFDNNNNINFEINVMVYFQPGE